MACVAALLFAGLNVGPASAAGGFFETFFGRPGYSAAPPTAYFQRSVPPAIQPLREQRLAITHRAHRHDRKKAATVNHGKHTVASRSKAATPMAYAPIESAGKPATRTCCASAQDAIAMVAHDNTLRPGDALMTPNGLKVFVGSSRTVHDKQDFVAISKAAGVGALIRSNLAVLVPPDQRPRTSPTSTTRRARMERPADPPPVTIHVAGAVPVMTIVDPRGRTLRFVGGYAGPAIGKDASAARPRSTVASSN